ncbi:hypothetical protein K474DRAFT_1688798 [Panus rudis PR-1116 ss-1]|nr:hypothetical protein K474DRAFT_1688798 [Panus rudis PR-1116 ss-1]
MAHQNLTPFLAERYEAVKNRFPGEGRRKWRLRVADEFWKLSPDEKAAYALKSLNEGAEFNVENGESAPYNNDEDPLDFIAGEDAPGLGIIVRADYSNEDAWQTFLSKLRAAEAELASGKAAEPEGAESSDDDDKMDEDQQPSSSNSAATETAEDDEDDDTPEASPIFAIFNPPPGSGLHSLLTRIPSPVSQEPHHPTNLTALRLLTDVDIRKAPLPPQGTKRIRPPNRLIDYDQWQEVYRGKGIWIYDERSNVDQCVRVVSLEGGAYGTATADSWRARVSHICELQVNLAAGAMTIDFGGLDRYDYNERLLNLAEAEKDIA